MVKDIKEYEVIDNVRLEELNCEGMILRHRATGARVAIIPNDDNNKTFCIGFRTPAPDDTGVPHIIEHTVLCGSNKFDVKDPFMELVKGSLNTFLNAMTYPDKTVYPVASTNDADFHNLVDVYMDAVFNPNIYKHEEIFKQEGWNYNLESENDDLTYNGVVYNEMKGAFSSPDDVLERQIMHSLYPDICYANESGGDPASIPELTYEKYLDFHRTYYHPSNSYIYLYGDADMEEYLRWFDEEYLSKYEYLDVDSEIGLQEPFKETITETAVYSITEDEDTADNTYLSYNTVAGVSGNKVEYMAFKILDYAICSMPGAPVKQALLDAGIGNDIYSGYSESMHQPYFSIIAKNANESDKDRFVKIVKESLAKLVKDGISEESIRAGINVFEFQFREADFGAYPKGLMYGLQMFDSWLYDDDKAFIHLQANETFNILRENIGTGYYEKLIDKYLLNNPHSSIVVVKPEQGLTIKMDKAVNDKLSEYKKTLTDEQIKKMVEATHELKAYQAEPSSDENLKKIPLLKISDIRKEVEKFDNELVDVDGVKVLRHNIFTNKIAYTDVLFDITDLPKKMLPYLGLLKLVIGYMDTDKHSYSEIANLINLNSGGIGMDNTMYADLKEDGKYSIFATFKSRVMYDRIEFAFRMIEELINGTIIDNEKRLLEILNELKSRLEMYLNQSGNSAASLRSQSYFSEVSRDMDCIKGISYYNFICYVIKNYDECKQDVINSLQNLLKYIFRKDNMLISCTANDEGFDIVKKYVKTFADRIIGSRDVSFDRAKELDEIDNNEGFKTSSQIQYVCRAGNFKKKGFDYSGHVKVLSTYLNYEYLWNTVRVQGGAYGCGSSFSRTGNAGFSSYRDPNLQKTMEAYENIPRFLQKINLSDREMTKFIIGTISGMDTPLTPISRGRRSLTVYMSNIDYDMLQQERDEVLSTTAEDLRHLAPLTKAVLDTNAICVIGNEGKIEEAKDMFGVTKNLFS